jgi:hypothetical protein
MSDKVFTIIHVVLTIAWIVVFVWVFGWYV